MENEKMDNWLKEEVEQLNEHKTDYEQLESLQFEEGKISTFQVLIDNPFDKYIDPADGKVKKIIPVMQKGVKKNLWLNVKNPLYSEIIRELYNGKVNFSVFQTGKAAETRYTLVKD